MKIKVNMSLGDRYDLLEQLIGYFFIDEFDPRSSFCYNAETESITMTIAFDENPPEQIMCTIKDFAEECITYLVFDGNNEDFSQEEENVSASESEPILSDDSLRTTTSINDTATTVPKETDADVEATDTTNINDMTTIVPEENDADIEAADLTKSASEFAEDLQRLDSEPKPVPVAPQSNNESSENMQKRKKLPTRLSESAEQFDFTEKLKKVYLELLEVAYNLKEPLSWKALKNAGFSVFQYDGRVREINQIIEGKYAIRTLTFVRKLLKEEKENPSTEITSVEENSPHIEGSFARVRKSIIESKAEFDDTLLTAVEKQLNSISKVLPMQTRVQKAIEIMGTDLDPIITQEIEFITMILELDKIDMRSPTLVARYGLSSLMVKRMNLRNFFQNKLDSYGMPKNTIVTLEDIFEDLRTMLQTEEERELHNR